MTVYFANEGLIDLDVIRTMGVNIKTNDNPIGYFGTGLKFAIATLLRTGHSVNLHRGDVRFEFSARRENIRNVNMNESARTLLEKHNAEEADFKPCGSLTDQHVRVLNAGIAVASKIGCDLSLDDVTVTESLGPNTHGLYQPKTGRIYISLAAVDLGENYVASTLYEEWLHKTHKLKDCTRELQTFLFNRLIAMVTK